MRSTCRPCGPDIPKLPGRASPTGHVSLARRVQSRCGRKQETDGRRPGDQRAPVSDRGAAFAPLHQRAFRDMWLAQFASNIGGWMQTVGAQWLMLSLTTSAVPVALI